MSTHNHSVSDCSGDWSTSDHSNRSWTNVVLRSESLSGMCAKLRTVAASNNKVDPATSLSSLPLATTINCSPDSQTLFRGYSPRSLHRDHSIIACSRHTFMVLCVAHIPLVVKRVFNATPAERLQQCQGRVSLVSHCTKPGSLFWCHAWMRLSFTHVRSFACRVWLRNLLTDCSAVGLHCVKIILQLIFKRSLQVTAAGVFPHVPGLHCLFSTQICFF